MISSKHQLIGDDEYDNVKECLDAGELSGNGPQITDYEAALCQAFDSAHAVACSSGTAAIYVALAALEVGSGDEVIVPPTAPSMTALPVLALGASVRFADVRPGSFALDPQDVARRTTPRTKAVIDVPMWGYADDLDELLDVCRSSGTALIEDGSQAHGSQVRGRAVGTRGVCGAFSTHARKLIATGEGGFLLTGSSDLAAAAQRIRSFGQSASGGEAFGDRFGLNFKLPGVLAALGRAQVARLPQRLAARNRVADAWLDALAGLPGVGVLTRPDVHNCYGLAITVPTAVRSRLDSALADSGVLTDTRAYRYRPLNEAPLFRTEQDCKSAVSLIDELIVLPCHEAVTEPVIERSCRILRETGSGRR